MKRILVLLLSATLILGVSQQAHAVTIEEVQEKGKQLENKKEQAEKEKNELVTKVNDILAKMKETGESLTKKEQEIKAAEERLIQAKIDENKQYEDMKMRIRYMYEEGQSNLITAILESKSMADLLNKVEYASELSSYDRDMLKEFQKTVRDVEEQEAVLKEEYEELSELQEKLTEQKKEVEQLLDSKNVEISNIEGELGKNAELLADLIAKAEAAKKAAEEAEAARKAEAERAEKAVRGGSSYVEPASKNIVDTGGATFANPCPGTQLTSGFGYRTFDNSFHKGYDLANGSSMPTYAAEAGTVIIAGWSNSAGNWVVINHGNGLVTKYMHHSVLYVHSGQHVERGQQLGMSGNTGYSAGIHLHFQVEVNGVAVNPGSYL